MSDRVADLPDGPLQIFCCGRKGQGKTELAWMLWNSWAGDALLIDINGDALKNHPDDAERTVRIDDPTLGQWPDHLREEEGAPLRLRYVPDDVLDEKAYKETLDRLVGMAFAHGNCLLWFDEVHEGAPSGQVPPHMRRALRMSRHKDLWMVFTDIRPITVDPLVRAQADVMYIFDTPNSDDQRALADAMGWDRKEVHDEIGALGDHCYLRFIAAEHELSVWPPLPLKFPKRQRTAEADLVEHDEPEGAEL